MMVILFMAVCFSNAQTAGDYYQQYEDAVKAEDYSKAFEAIKKCDDMCYHAPLSSFSLGMMYLMGKGTPVDTTQALISFSMATSYTYRVNQHLNWNKFGQDLGMSSSTIHGIEGDIKEMNRQYSLYMQLSPYLENVIMAFAYRWIACLYIEPVNTTTDLEERLECASSAMDNAQKADSLCKDAYADYLLGKIHYEGLIGVKDYEKSAAYLEDAASRGSISAVTFLGEIYKDIDDKKGAKRMWKLAAETDIKPLILPTRTNIRYFLSSNIDIGDVREMKARAINYLKK